VIYAVNHRVVGNVAQLRETLRGMKSGQAAVLTIEREGHLIYVPIELD
jgi:S1-C subfamily serine protease